MASALHWLMGEHQLRTFGSTADPLLLESNLVVAQGQRHRADRDTIVKFTLIENLFRLAAA